MRLSGRTVLRLPLSFAVFAVNPIDTDHFGKHLVEQEQRAEMNNPDEREYLKSRGQVPQFHSATD